MKRIISLLMSMMIMVSLITASPITAEAAPTVFSQISDGRWNKYPYPYKNNDKTIGTSGCGLLALTNAIYYMNGNFINPKTLADFSLLKGYRASTGTSHGLYPAASKEYGEDYGFNCSSAAGNTSTEKLAEHLASGGTVVASSTTIKTGNGHLMAIVDYNSSTNKFLILDSYVSSNRFSSDYSWQTINEDTLITGNGKVKFKKFIYLYSKAKPAAPTITSAEAKSSTSIEVKWKSVAGATKYRVDRRIDKSGSKYETLTDNCTKLSFTDKNDLKANTVYFYRVYAINSAGTSDKPTTYRACTMTNTPGEPKVHTDSDSQLTVRHAHAQSHA